MTFEEEFPKWISAKTKRIPSKVKAICLNLAEPAFADGVTFSIELVGCDRFDLDDPDWPCDEVWRPFRGEMHIPTSFSSDDWETCLKKMIELEASDLHMTTGVAPHFRLHGDMIPVSGSQELNADQMKQVLFEIAPPENIEQFEFLRENDCDFAQGYYYSKPLRNKEFVAFIEKEDFHTQRRKALEVVHPVDFGKLK